MNIKFIKANDFDFHNYSVFLNNKKINLNENVDLGLTDTKNSFNIKTYWFKTQEYNIVTNHKDCVVKIDNIIRKKVFVYLISILAILILTASIYENQNLWYVASAFGILWLFFQIYIYTFGRKKYINIKFEYLD